MIIVYVHILDFQRDIFVGWIVHIELKVPLLIRVQKMMDIYMCIYIYMCVCLYIYIYIYIYIYNCL